MCFSAEADFVSGALIGAIGVATLSQVEKPREIPLAALPAAFALHQFTEGFVWRDLDADAGATHATGPAVFVYLVFAWILIPVVVPLAIMALEPPGRTRRRIGVFVGIGAVANVVAVGVIATVQARGLTSIWCSWAATVSILIFFQLVAWRNADRDDLACEGEQSDQVTAASM